MDANNLGFEYHRRFGLEIELNAFDGKTGPFTREKPPCGIYDIASIVSNTLGEYVEVRIWQPTHHEKNHNCWCVKPDGSCGMEICTPISKGRIGLKKACDVVDALDRDCRVMTDSRCSLHVHVEVADCDKDDIAKIVAYWIKCEPVFLDAVPKIRKNNRYCQFIGVRDWFDLETVYDTDTLLALMGTQKYLSLNTFHYNKIGRPTIEFRIGENALCRNSFSLKNWVQLIIHFVEMAKRRPAIRSYVENDPWSSLVWLDPKAVFELLGFDGSYVLSPGMLQIRNWFLCRLRKYQGIASDYAILSHAGRQCARKEVEDFIDIFTKDGTLQLNADWLEDRNTDICYA